MASMRRPSGSHLNFLFGFVKQSLFFRRVATDAMLPFALSEDDSFARCILGRSRFSRCCYLIGALWFCSSESNLGQAINAVTGTRLWALVFSLPGTVLIWFCLFVYAAAATVVRLLLCNGSYTSPLTHK